MKMPKNLLAVSLFSSFLASCQCGPNAGASDSGVDGGNVRADGGPNTSGDGGPVITPGDAGTTCPAFLTTCNGVCVDVTLDNANCGSCGRACPAGQGCTQNACIPSLTMGPGPTTCPGSGSPVVVQVPDGGSVCTGLLAQTTFRWGLCACDTIALSGQLTTDGFNSSMGPYMSGSLGGSVGTNGAFTTQSVNSLGGSLWSASNAGLSVSGECNVRQELHLGGPFESSARFQVGLDAYVNGNMTASGQVTIGQTLRVPQTSSVSPRVMAASVVRQTVTVPNPCDCSESQIIPVAGIVAARRTNNDNASIGLAAAALVNVSAPRRLDLPCGHYYLSRVSASAPITIVAHGRTILYVDGDITSQGELSIAADLNAELDVFVAGTISSSGGIRLGNPLAPARTRVYLASTQALGISASLQLGAFLYAPKTAITASGGIEAFGGIVSGSFRSSASTTLHYDLAVLKLAQECAGADAGRPDAGPGPVRSCMTCGDCGNQACVGGTCGSCATNADCCAPLLCENGTCVGIN